MAIYLMRHGEAVHPSQWRGSDQSRPLSSLGEAKMEAAAKGMKTNGFSINLVLSSPYERAKRTAEIIAKELGVPLVLDDQLASGTKADTMRDCFFKHLDKFPALLVGHMPELATFATKINFEPSFLEKGFEPGEMMALEPGPLQTTWGESTFLWWRKTGDWLKVK